VTAAMRRKSGTKIILLGDKETRVNNLRTAIPWS